MSQEKVNRYKEEKANRAKILKKKKRQAFLAKLLVSVVGVVLVGWIGFSVYKTAYKPPVNTYSMDITAINDFVSDLTAETEAE